MRKVFFYIGFFIIIFSAVLYTYLKQEYNRKSARQKVEEQLAKKIEDIKDLNPQKINLPSTESVQKNITDILTTVSAVANADTLSSPPLSSLPNGQIGGRVIAVDKSPIAKVELQLIAYAEGGDKFIKSELSDNEGKFLFANLPAGTYELRTFHLAYATKAVPEIQLSENQVINDLEIVLTAGVKQSGKVINEKSEPIEKATVFVNKQVTRINPSGGIPLSASYKCGETLTSSDGTFILEHVPGGEVEIGARKSGYSDAVLQLHINEEVEPEPVVIILKEAAVIGGTVVDPEGKPVEGAEVSVFGIVGADSEHHPLPVSNMRQATTDKKGEFIIKGLLADTRYDLKVVASGFPVCYFFDIKSNTLGNRLVLCFGGKISGKVTYLADAKPAPDIRIKAERMDITKYCDTALTNQQGEYLILNLPAGKYRVSIDSDFYTAPPKENLIVEAGKEVKEVNFKIYRGLNINGEVVDRRNGSGIADARVFLNGEITGDGKLKKNVTTEKDGDFVFENLPEGLYYLYAEAKGYVSSNNDRDRKKVLLKLGNPAPFVSIKLQPGGTISGTVYNKQRQPLSYAFVQLFQPQGARGGLGGIKTHQLTDTVGRFKFEGLNVSNAIEVYVRAVAEGYAPGISPPVLLTPSEPDAVTEVTLGAGGGITGTVHENSADGPPLAYVQITATNNLLRNDSSFRPPVTYTDGSGKFSLYNLMPGQITVKAQLPGYVSAEKSVRLAEGEVKSLQFILSKGLTITGIVTDDLKNPLERVHISASPKARGPTISTFSDNNGMFVLSNLTSNLHNLFASYGKQTPQGYQHYQRQRTDIPAGSKSIQIVFPINGEIQGTVLDAETGQPIEGFRVYGSGTVELDSNGNTTGFHIPEKQYVQTNGKFQCYALPTGVYSITAYAEGYLPQTLTSLQVTSPFKLDVGTIYLFKGGGIKLTLLSQLTREPISGVYGELDSGVFRTAHSNAEGVMEFKCVREGIYTLKLVHGHYQEKTISKIPVSAGQTTDLGTVFLEPGATINGKVRDGRNSPMAGVQITAKATNKTHQTRTSQFGYYYIDGVKAGPVEVSADVTIAGLAVSQSRTIDVMPDLIYEINFVFDASYTIRGVFRAPGYRLLDPKLYIYPLDERGAIRESQKREVTPAPDLSYTVSRLLQGRYFLIAEATPEYAGSVPVTLTRTRCYALVNLASSEYICDFFFPASLISGTIIDPASGSPTPNLQLTLQRVPEVTVTTPATLNRFRFTAVSEDTGEFCFSPLPAGNYQLFIGSNLVDTFYLAENQQITNLQLFLR